VVILDVAREAVKPLLSSVMHPNYDHSCMLAWCLQGFEGALKAGATEVAIFGAASEAFSQRNLNCSIADSLKRFGEVAAAARKHNIAVRG
jgi:isopropylmalate/homocitrate/citramalate synthase